MKRFVFLSLSLLLLLILIPGCITFQTSPSEPTPPVGTPPVIIAFSNNPSTINAGDTSTLMWNVTGANSVSIDQGIGQVAVAGTSVVSPAVSTTYTITASNSNGSVTAQVTVTIGPGSLPVIVSFTSTPSTISSGQYSHLAYIIQGDTTSVTIDQGVGTASTWGVNVYPAITTTYTLTATNSAGSATRAVTVTVSGTGGVPVINSFTGSPLAITAGNQSTLSWAITGATSVSINQGVGTVNATSGSHQVSPNTTTAYTLTATNAAGSSTSQITVTVGVAGQPVINSFTANPITINAGQTSTLTWNIINATSASINQGINIVNATSGTYTVTPAATITYILTATNSAGSVTATATVTVSGTNVPVINNFTANPTTVTSGGASTLSWSVTGATAVSIDQGIGTVVTSGTSTVNPIATTMYTLTASNSYGSVTAQVTVIIGTGNLPVIVSFTATPSTISSGQSSILKCIIQGDLTSVTIDQGVGAASPWGVNVYPATTTTYTLTATNSAGSVTRTVTVTVQ